MSKPQKKAIEVLLPPAVGYSFSILINFYFRNRIALRYYPRLLIIGLINLINFPFRTYERWFINPRYKKMDLEKDPVFIIGHWRSGTTHLHNLLTQDPQMGYLTTYQGVFPDTLFNKAGRFIFKNFTRILIPTTRKGDNVKLKTDNPQEEEFALGDKIELSYYYFWMFPFKTLEYYDRALRGKGVDAPTLDRWKTEYKTLIKKSLKNTGRVRYLSKNPPHTARIEVLLDMFPNAKFIHIHRNPVEVFLSTRHFFNVMMPHLQLQKMDDAARESIILEVYKKMMHHYLEDYSAIPEKNLIEVSFDDLERDPIAQLETIYKNLDLPGFTTSKPFFETYVQRMKSYKKNKHLIERETLDRILKEWSFAMERWNYQIPGTVEIIEEKK